MDTESWLVSGMFKTFTDEVVCTYYCSSGDRVTITIPRHNTEAGSIEEMANRQRSVQHVQKLATARPGVAVAAGLRGITPSMSCARIHTKSCTVNRETAHSLAVIAPDTSPPLECFLLVSPSRQTDEYVWSTADGAVCGEGLKDELLCAFIDSKMAYVLYVGLRPGLYNMRVGGVIMPCPCVHVESLFAPHKIALLADPNFDPALLGTANRFTLAASAEQLRLYAKLITDCLAEHTEIASVCGAIAHSLSIPFCDVLNTTYRVLTEYGTVLHAMDSGLRLPLDSATWAKQSFKFTGGSVLIRREARLFVANGSSIIAYLDFGQFYPRIMQELGAHAGGSVKHAVAYQRSLLKRRREAVASGNKPLSTAMKLLANNVYGMLGTRISPFCNREFVQRVTASGVIRVTEMTAYAERLGAVQLYRHTDGAILKFPDKYKLAQTIGHFAKYGLKDDGQFQRVAVLNSTAWIAIQLNGSIVGSGTPDRSKIHPSLIRLLYGSHIARAVLNGGGFTEEWLANLATHKVFTSAQHSHLTKISALQPDFRSTFDVLHRFDTCENIELVHDEKYTVVPPGVRGDPAHLVKIFCKGNPSLMKALYSQRDACPSSPGQRQLKRPMPACKQRDIKYDTHRSQGAGDLQENGDDNTCCGQQCSDAEIERQVVIADELCSMDADVGALLGESK